MRVETRGEDQGRTGPGCVGAMKPSRGMDGDVGHGAQHKRRSLKNKAPPPPAALHRQRASSRVPALPNEAMDQKESPLEQELLLTVVLPEGVEKSMMVHGSKPMMDLLVMLCAKYHLNPSSHTLELISTNKNHIKYKPNALIGALEAEKVLLKAKGLEDKSKKSGPSMPEATVRLVINYKKTQKTILRVNPRVALQDLLPAICEKCEFEPQSTVLLRNVNSEETLDLRNSLNDLGLRELYAQDTRVSSPGSFPPSPTPSDVIQPGKNKQQKEKENKGLFGMFRRGSKKKTEQASAVSAPASPINRKARPMSLSSLSMHSPTYDSNTMPTDMPKKRRAPLPPNMRPSDLNHHENSETTQPDGNQVKGALSRSLSAESSLKRSKRKAPQPPTSPNNISVELDEKTQDEDSLRGSQTPLEEVKESRQVPDAPVALLSSSPESLSPVEELLEDDSSINLSADVSMDSGRAGTSSPCLSSEPENTAPPGGAPLELSCDVTTDGKPGAGSEVNGGQVESEDRLQLADNAGFEARPAAPRLTVESSPAMKDEATLTTDIISYTEVDEFPSPASSHALNQNQRAEPQAPPKPGRITASVQTVQDDDPGVAGHTNAEIQTEAPEVAETPPEAPSQPCSTSASIKRDMGTSTEELQLQKVHPAAQTSTPSGAKPKPSIIPKAGTTSYTVIPLKSKDMLRSFEVALTLVSPGVPGSPTKSRPGSASELARSAPQSPVSPDVKKKVPPATRPKPASFRLPQHNRSPGSYVSSAAVRSMSLSDSVTPGSPQRQTSFEVTDDEFPPPPPPVQWEDREEETRPNKDTSSPVFPEASSGPTRSPLPRQTSLPIAGLSLEKLRSFAAPKPYSPNTPSRFAQAVSSAVQRSKSLTHSPTDQPSHRVPLALTKRSPFRESDEVPESPTSRDVDRQRTSSSDSYTSPADDSDEVWKRRTPDFSSVSQSNAHYV